MVLSAERRRRSRGRHYFCSCHALPEQLTGLEPRGLLPPPLPRRDPGLAYGLAWLGCWGQA